MWGGDFSPQGLQGPKGDKGDAGPQGPDGTYVGWKDLGNFGTYNGKYNISTCDYRLRYDLVARETSGRYYYYYYYFPLRPESIYSGPLTNNIPQYLYISWEADLNGRDNYLFNSSISPDIFEAFNCSNSAACSSLYFSIRNSKFYKDTTYYLSVSPNSISVISTDVRTGSFLLAEAPPATFHLKASKFHIEENCYDKYYNNPKPFQFFYSLKNFAFLGLIFFQH